MTRIVIAGFGDTGMLTAIHLGKGFDIVAISSKPCMVSGQELGMRLAQTELWKRFYLTPFNRYPKLDAARIHQGLATAVDTQARQLHYVDPEGVTHTLDYDVLVIATGTRNGFWRNNQLQSIEEIEHSLDAHRALLAAAPRVNVIGAGPTGVSAAYNLKLSQQRANSVKNMLVRRFGIDPNRLQAVGVGQAEPKASNKTLQGRAQNRRVELTRTDR